MKVCSLFSGIGGFDKGFIDAGFEIVWANDRDKYAVETYRANYDSPIVLDDFDKVDLSTIPNFDVLIGGFPCQPFSMMGKRKGFDDARGTCFFRIAELINQKLVEGNPPKAIVLENVRGLKTHDGGKTFSTIQRILENFGYSVHSAVLNSADYGVPQTRNRTFIVCFFGRDVKYEFPPKIEQSIFLQDILEENVADKYFLSEKIKKTILSSGTGGYYSKSEIDLKIARPLCATMAKMHRACQDNYVTQNGRIRRLTPRECARLQGFDDDFSIPVSDTQAYKQFGNAVTVNVSRSIAQGLLDYL